MAMIVPKSCSKMLFEQGLVPKNCRSVELVVPADGVVIIRYEVFATTEDLDKFATVVRVMASESKPVQDGD